MRKMNHTVLASATELVRQAGATARSYLNEAVSSIDEIFGAGYAKSNPELVATYMRTAAQDYHSAILLCASENIGHTINNLAEAILEK